MMVIQSPRLQLSQFQMMDAHEVFGCITPAIARFMRWEPPSWSEYVARSEKRVQAPEPNKFSFVIRRLDNRECLGMAGLEDADSVSPEIGLWLKESAHRQGFGGKSWPHLLSGDTELSAKESNEMCSKILNFLIASLRVLGLEFLFCWSYIAGGRRAIGPFVYSY